MTGVTVTDVTPEPDDRDAAVPPHLMLSLPIVEPSGSATAAKLPVFGFVGDDVVNEEPSADAQLSEVPPADGQPTRPTEDRPDHGDTRDRSW